jgi:hypothetical protein
MYHRSFTGERDQTLLRRLEFNEVDAWRAFT